MESFTNKIAVITGGGSGIGRELARQLAGEGCHLALCDVNAATLDATRELCLAAAPAETRVFAFVADVSREADLAAFRDSLLAAHDTDRVHLVFNNAGIGGGGSFLDDPRAVWERTFDICWYGVYYGCRIFLPLLLKAAEGHLVNTSSTAGIWGSMGPSRPLTAYAAAKFAVRGLSEALVTELRLRAPHVKISVVMPGHIGTDIVLNSAVVHGAAEVPGMKEYSAAFRDSASTSAENAAVTILNGVRAGRWRILVGHDALIVDELVRADPEAAYEADFVERLHRAGVLDEWLN